MNNNPEVRYHMLRPTQIVERRTKKAVAYIPIGTIEWHGMHNPLGVDGLQAEGLAIMCAQKGGGLVFPTLYYGESRVEGLVDSTSSEKELMAKKMLLDVHNFSDKRQPFCAMEQTLNYHKLLIHILAEVETLGFDLGVFVIGHYPLIDSAKAAVIHFNKREFSRKEGMLAWAAVDFLLLENIYKQPGDHAAGWETSHLLYLHPETVDLNELNHSKIGVRGKLRPPEDATGSFGEKTLKDTSEIIIQEVNHRLLNPKHYKRHGRSFETFLWEEDKI